LFLGLSTFHTVAEGQLAADKATARELAAAGIEDLQEGHAASAEKRLKKAQALYDAPVHLLYLARAQVELGKFVEASENYRLLSRSELGPDAPTAFVRAKLEGERELSALEPRLARLTIDVEPGDIDGLVVRVNGAKVNSAILSTARPSNPGPQEVEVLAPGYEPARLKLTLEEGTSERVNLVLVLRPDEASGASGSAAASKDSAEDSPADEGTSGSTGLILGLRIGGVLPAGELQVGTSMTDYFQPGVYGRAELGLRFARYLGVKGYFGLGALSPGEELEALSQAQDLSVLSNNKASVMDAGVALLATMDPRKLGGFGEVGLSILHQYQWSQTLSSSVAEFDDCKNVARYPGLAVRAGGGMNIPLTDFMTLVPNIDVQVGQLRKLASNYQCPSDISEPEALPPPAGELEKSIHYQIFLGAGVDFHLGDTWFQ